MNRPLRSVFLLVPVLGGFLWAQSVKLLPEPGFVPYATYYVSSFDPATGATDVILFSYRLAEESGDYQTQEVWVEIDFSISVVSPALGIPSNTSVLHVKTDPFRMEADVRFDNRELSTETTTLVDVQGRSIEDFTVRILKQLDISQFESMLSSIMSTGKLPDGQYSFQVHVNSGPSPEELVLTDEVTEVLLVTTPTSLNLISPGGDALTDTSDNMVFTPYPIFQWETEPCPGCESFIRVAPFDPESHSSPEEAVEDVTVLPMDYTEGWEPVGITTTFQYPFSGAIELIPGEVYAWQVRKDLPTTQGTDSFISPIFVFKIADVTQQAAAPEIVHPILLQLVDVMGEEQFNAYFGTGGELSGFTPTGTYMINGLEVPVDAVFGLINEMMNQSVSIVNVSVE
ncbi:MAG: hypothetical protein ACE5HZ_08025 [Fidelibacterota bacterium]